MKKLVKWFSIFAVIGTAAGLAAAYFFKKKTDNAAENETDFTEDEDFDLDADLKPAGREYVSLTKEKEEAAQASDQEPETDAKPETAEEPESAQAPSEDTQSETDREHD